VPAGTGAVAGGAGTLLLAAAIVGGAYVYDMGAVRVSVKSKSPGGENIRLVLPAAVAPVGMWLAPKEKLREAAEQARPYLPALEVAADELGRGPDFALVEVTNPREKVRIAKEGTHLVIDVDDANEVVHVAVPLNAVRAVAAQLGAIPPAPTGQAEDPSPSEGHTL